MLRIISSSGPRRRCRSSIEALYEAHSSLAHALKKDASDYDSVPSAMRRSDEPTKREKREKMEYTPTGRTLEGLQLQNTPCVSTSETGNKALYRLVRKMITELNSQVSETYSRFLVIQSVPTVHRS